MDRVMMFLMRVNCCRSSGVGSSCGTARMAVMIPMMADARYIRCLCVVVSERSHHDTTTLMGILMHARTAMVDVRI